MADRGYQLVIGANFVGKTYAYLYLDTCMEKDITSSAHIPTQPLQDGNTIADHMYRNPDEYTISGVFSLYGKYGNDKRYDNMPIISDQGDRLGNIQSVFEYIKDNGILCDLTTIQEDDYGTVRFKQRNNMALESIRWKENQASMNYTFTFKEIICVNVQEDVAKTDSDLPNIYSPVARSLGEVLISTNGITEIVIRALLENEWIECPESVAAKNVADTMVATFNAIIPIKDLISLFSKNGNKEDKTRMAATLAIGLAPGLGSIYHYISTMLSNEKRTKARTNVNNVFRLIYNVRNYIDEATGQVDVLGIINDPNCTINESELLRLNDFLTKIKNEVLDTYSNLMFYEISSGKDDNEEREIVINIGNNTYYIAFNKDKSRRPETWSMSVTTQGNKGEESLNCINGKMLNSWCPCYLLDEMDVDTNCIFLDKTRNYEVYLYCTKDESNSNKSDDLSTSGIKNEKTYLCDYQLVVSYGHVSDHIQKIYDTIYNALIKEYYN